MMDYKEEPTCSNDVVIATEDEETACTTKYIVQADVPLSVFDEMISDVQDDVTGDVPKVAMASLVDYGMNATFDVEANGDDTDLIGYCNQFNGNGFDENITQYESMAEFETFYGQALFKAGKAEESIIHFKKGVGYLGINIPSTKVGSAFNLAYQAVKHFLHAKTSKLFQKKKQYQHLDGVQCERAHCMGQLTKVYHHQQQNLLALMSSYQQLNAAEKCGDLYELMEAYASVIDCCQSYSLDNLSEHYVKKANKKSSEINLDDSTATLHLLRSTMMFELCHGEIVVAGQKGKTAKSIAGKHNASLLLTTSIEYLSTELLMLNTPAIKECLDQMCDIPKDLEDHDRITALITCGNFDVFLEIGMKPDDFEGMIEAAKRYSIQKFPTGEDFYLATCLATWYARIRQWRLAMKYITIANSKTPTSYNFAMTKALCRQAECLLLLDNSLDDKTISKLASKTMKKLKKKIKTCRVFGPRYMMLRSYQLLGEKKYSKAQDMLLDSITGAKRMFNYCDASWAELNKLNWFPGRKEPSIMQQQQFSFFSFP
ncbi:uncharacterized protein [Dysidea avara]|uniref:uncharacterized protein n=1 Tax=Dysidea avara TaxID=196820 RepID=UPI00332FF78C